MGKGSKNEYESYFPICYTIASNKKKLFDIKYMTGQTTNIPDSTIKWANTIPDSTIKWANTMPCSTIKWANTMPCSTTEEE